MAATIAFPSGRRPALAAMFMLLCGALAGCTPSGGATSNQDAANKAAAALTVTVAEARSERMSDTTAATGSVVAWQEVTVSAELSGMALREVLVGEGDRVAAGAVLARLDDATLKADIAIQEATVAEAQATLDAALAAKARGDKLVASNAISKETAEDRETTARTSQAKLDQAKAALDKLRVELDETVIKAPVAGTISEKPAAAGIVVQSGTELFKIIRDGRLEVAASVAEQDLGGIVPGASARVTDAAGTTTIGTVRAVATKVDSSTRLGTVYVSLPTDTALKIGMFTRVSLDTVDAVALTVPESSLVWRGGKPAVFVVGADDVVVQRIVETGSRIAGRVAVTGGLTAGERVVASGAGFLADGDRVNVVVAADAAAAEVTP